MKTCQPCGTKSDDAVVSCRVCGEASWAATEGVATKPKRGATVPPKTDGAS